jgi:hypothetical protein
MFRRLFAFALMLALAAGEIPVQAAGVSAIGVVTQAYGANLARANVSTGAAVFDGDSFSTAPDGLLRIRAGAAQLYLAGQSSVKLNSVPNGTLAQLTVGRLVFSSAKAAAMDVEFAQAHIRAASDQPTVVQVSVVNGRMIDVRANRGAIQFSYKDETETIPEGKDARILLDPTDEELATALPTATPAFPDQQQPRRGRKRRLAFFIFWGSVAGITTGILLHHALESPEKP